MDDKFDEILQSVANFYARQAEATGFSKTDTFLSVSDAKAALKTLMNEYAIEHADGVIGEDESTGWADMDAADRNELRAEQRRRNKIEPIPKIVRKDKFYNGNGHVGTKNYYDDGSVKIETEE